MYVPEMDRIVLRDKVSERMFANVGTVRKTAITTKVLQLIYELCSKGIHTTKRDLFYTDVKLFQVRTISLGVLLLFFDALICWCLSYFIPLPSLDTNERG